MGISCNSPRIRRGFLVIQLSTARLPRLLRSLAMTSQGGFPHPEGRKGKPESAFLPCHSEERSDVGISSRHLRFRRGFPVFRACTARLPRLLRSLAMTSQGAFPTRRGAMTNPRADAVGGQPRRIHMPFPGIATFPIQQTDPPIWDSSSLSAHLSFCGTSSLSASHARLLLSHPVLFQNKLIYEHDIAL